MPLSGKHEKTVLLHFSHFIFAWCLCALLSQDSEHLYVYTDMTPEPEESGNYSSLCCVTFSTGQSPWHANNGNKLYSPK